MYSAHGVGHTEEDKGERMVWDTLKRIKEKGWCGHVEENEREIGGGESSVSEEEERGGWGTWRREEEERMVWTRGG
jgi:hypothetical protein